MTLAARGAAGLLAAAIVAESARRAGSLSRSGAVAATLVGTAAIGAGWAWGALLVGYFVASVALSRLGRDIKERRTASVVAKGGRRDAVQVLANGGLFALLACVALRLPLAATAALGALAAAMADTWATEVGTLLEGTPRSLRTLQPVPPGTSGGVSVPGTAALVAGALTLALAARLAGLGSATVAIATGGIAGAMADSMLGMTLQERRWCPRCERGTERRVHDCGATTTWSAGVPWMDNDAVNFAATVVGAVTAALLAMPSRTHSP